MTRDAVNALKPQTLPNGRRSYRSSRRVVQSDNMSALSSNQSGNWDLTGGRGSPQSLLPQLNPSPLKNSWVQYSPQFSSSETSDSHAFKLTGLKNRRSGNFSPTQQGGSPMAVAALLGTPRQRSGQSSTASYFAGSKFGDAPPPTILPLPPSHWISGSNKSSLGVQVIERSGLLSKEECCIGLTSGLKVLLHVQ